MTTIKTNTECGTVEITNEGENKYYLQLSPNELLEEIERLHAIEEAAREYRNLKYMHFNTHGYDVELSRVTEKAFRKLSELLGDD